MLFMLCYFMSSKAKVSLFDYSWSWISVIIIVFLQAHIIWVYPVRIQSWFPLGYMYTSIYFLSVENSTLDLWCFRAESESAELKRHTFSLSIFKFDPWSWNSIFSSSLTLFCFSEHNFEFCRTTLLLENKIWSVKCLKSALYGKRLAAFAKW
jgi:hypothetical protein